MDFYVEPAFFVIALVVAALAALLGIAGRPLARYGCVVSLTMLGLLLFRTPAALLYAAAYLAGSVALYRWVLAAFVAPGEEEAPDAAGKGADGALARASGGKASGGKASGGKGAARKGPDARALTRYRVALAIQLAPLVLYKLGVVVRPDFPGFLGISYITFKALQVLIEVRDGLIFDMTAFEYLYFLAFFPTFTSGPILRSRPFVADLRATPDRDLYLDRLYRGIGWFVLGALYKFVGSALAQWALWFVPTLLGNAALAWLAQVFFYGLDLFFDFAGYSDMAMGLGLALGVEVPRNFRAPFVATDIKLFWDRWHISLSTWLRDFVFMRFSRFAMARKLFASRNVTACVGFALNMLLMGVWHGVTPDYVVYGCYHGLLLAGCHYYQQTSAFHKRHRRERWYLAVSWALTMVAVFFGFALFGGYVVSPLLGS